MNQCRYREGGAKEVNDGMYFQLRLTVNLGKKKKGTKRLSMNMTEQFGLSPNISKKRLHQFSYIGAAMLLMQLDQGAQTKKVCRSKKCTQKSTSDPPAVSAKTLQKLIQSDGEDDSEDSCTDLPALTELSDDDSPSDEDSNCENHDDRISYISRRRGEQTAAASSARWKKTTQLERARKSGRIAPTDFRPPTKRRKTDAQRQVHVAVERMKTAAEEIMVPNVGA